MRCNFGSDSNDKYDVMDDAMFCQEGISKNKWSLMDYVYARFYNKGNEMFDSFYEMAMCEMQDEFQQPKVIK